MVCDAGAAIARRDQVSEETRILLLLACLCHDLGKATTTIFDRGRWRSPKHSNEGAVVAEEFLNSISCPESISAKVIPLVKEHIFFASLGDNVSKRVTNRLLDRLTPATMGDLMLLIEADLSGRDPKAPAMPIVLGKVLSHLD